MEDDLINGVLAHPTTVRLFFYCKSTEGDIRVRQAQRDLDIKSTSTVNWHLTKLVDSGLMERRPNNSYILSDTGRAMNSIPVPITQSVFFIKHHLFTTQSFFMALVMTTTLLSILLALTLPELALVYSVLSLCFISGYAIYQYGLSRQMLEEYRVS